MWDGGKGRGPIIEELKGSICSGKLFLEEVVVGEEWATTPV